MIQFSNRNEIFEETFLAFIFFLLIIGYPLSEKKFWAKDDLVWLGFSLNIPEKSVEFPKRNEDPLWKTTNFKRYFGTFAKPSPICCGFFTMGLANVPMA